MIQTRVDNCDGVALGGVDEFTFFASNVSPSVLLAGTNVIAVEIHQSSAGSSDISFDCELLGHIGANFPRVFIERSGTNRIVRWSSAANYFSLYAAPSLTPPVSWIKVIAIVTDDGTWRSTTRPDTGASEFYKLATE